MGSSRSDLRAFPADARSEAGFQLRMVQAGEGPRMTSRFRRSSGNVFLDVGFPPHQAQNLRVRADLMTELIRIVRSRKLTQASASKLFGVSQPRVSDLMTGKIDRFSIDALVEMLSRAGRRVEIAMKPARRVA